MTNNLARDPNYIHIFGIGPIIAVYKTREAKNDIHREKNIFTAGKDGYHIALVDIRVVKNRRTIQFPLSDSFDGTT